MIKNRSVRISSLGVALFSLGLLLQNAPARQKTEFKMEAGVTIISNPKKPSPRPGGPSRLLLKEDLVIGRESTAGGYLFADLRSVGVDDRENIWTLDWKDIKVRVFDKTGKLISAFGRKGQGPEEWQAPGRMVVLADGTAAIRDLNKLTFYSLEGKCLREVPLVKTNMSRFRIDSRGVIYGDRIDAGEKYVIKLIRYDQSLNPVATLADVEEPIKPGARNYFLTFLYCHVTGDDRLIWMSNATYAFHVLNPDGKPVKTITKDYEPVKITDGERKAMLAKYKENPAYQKQMVFPAAYPPVNYFVGDAEGRLFAQTYEKNDKGELLFDVFDADGRCITRFSLPEDETLSAVNKNKLYVLVKEDAEGRPLVKRYAMEWK